MKIFKLKPVNRVLSVLLALAMMFELLPSAVSASTVNHPNIFTISVTDGSAPITGASVAYTVASDLEATAETDADGVVTIDMTSHAAEFAASTLSISYTVTKDGYTDVSASDVSVTDIVGNINVTMQTAPVQRTVTVTTAGGSGSGTVTLNNTEQSSVTVNDGTDVAVVLTPDEGCYISALSIDGTAVGTLPEKGSPYSGTISANADKTISVTFTKQVTVTASITGSGTVKLNDSDGPITVDKDASVDVAVTPGEGYQIGTVSFNGAPQTVDNSASFNSTITVSADMSVTVTFVQTVTVTVSWGANGTVTTSPAVENNGSVSVAKGTDFTVTATPNTNYRVSSVVVNGGAETGITGVNDETFNKSYSVDQDYIICVTFAPNRYSVTASKTGSGTVNISAPSVDYNGSSTVTLTPDDGYELKTVTVNGTDMLASVSEDFTLSLTNITADQTIAATFTAIGQTGDTGLTITPVGGTLISSGIANGILIYSNGTSKVTISTSYLYIRVKYQNQWHKGTSSVSIAETETIQGIEVRNSKNASWQHVTAAPSKIIIDQTAPTAVLTPDQQPNSNGYYNTDFQVAVSPSDSESGIGTVDYVITKDDGTKTTPENLYTYSNTTPTPSNLNIPVSAAAYNGNSNIIITVTVKDRAGNTKAVTPGGSGLKVDTTAPTVTLTPDAPNTNGCYNSDFNIAVSPSDECSGIWTVEYAIKNDTGARIASGNLFTYSVSNPTPSSLKVPVIAADCDGNTNLVVTVTVMDRAGNQGTVSAQGLKVDTTAPTVTLTPDAANANGYYNADFNVAVKTEDGCTGIQKISYEVLKDGTVSQSGDLYSYQNGSTIQNSLSNTLTIISNKNNSDNVTLNVTVTDLAENTFSAPPLNFKVNCTQPAISVSLNGTPRKDAAAGYYDMTRTARITVTDRDTTFRWDAVLAGLSVAAKDAAGNAVPVDKNDMLTDRKDSGDTHTANLVFSADAAYEWSLSYTNLAGLANAAFTPAGDSAYRFTVDTTAPTGMISLETNVWDKLLSALTFGIWKNYEVTPVCTGKDATSPLYNILYYKSDADTPLTGNALEEKFHNGEFTTSPYTISATEQFSVYARITDYAGNTAYLGSDGITVDMEGGTVALTPAAPNENGFYNSDVPVEIDVTEAGNIFSGIRTIDYQVVKDGDGANPTQFGNLYTFGTTNPTRDQLTKNIKSSITVDAAKNNSNDVKVIVTAEDNAGNRYRQETALRIDITAPAIDISYSNNSAENDTYFKADRTALITVTERNFNPDDVQLSITGSNGAVPEFSGWNETADDADPDQTRWAASLIYSADADYTFGIAYADLAGNACAGERYAADTAAAHAFTVDKTLPVINVSYDNNDAQNTDYYKNARTAVISITEHNFDADSVQISTMAENGAAPAAGGWSGDGDTHTATIYYGDDNRYTFAISYTDRAGNQADPFTTQTFCIDKTAPALSITGVEDNSANKGSVAPVVTYSDTNYDPANVTITLTGANRKSVALDGKYTDIDGGRTFTFNDFAKEQSADDIYTLTASLTDKAGNTTAQTIHFSVNRFGSTYALSPAAQTLNGTYVQAPTNVVIDETNVNALKNIKITLFKNDKTITLQDGTDYKVDVTGGNGEWYHYTYTIFKKYFEDDGVYRITVHSEDAAGNVAENTLDTKNTSIGFGVDKTSPNVSISNLENGITYAFDTYTVQMSAEDNLKLASIVVYLDGNQVKQYSEKEIDAAGGSFSFEIPGDSIAAHSMKIVCTDAAGNTAEDDIGDFYVTTNLWIRYYNNKLLFWGSIITFLVLAGLVIFLILYRRKKNGKDQQENPAR